MGDVDHRRLQILVQFRKLRAHLHTQRRIQIGQRFIEQEDVRIADDGAADGNALALAA